MLARIAASNMVMHPKVNDEYVRSVLKEVGLQDMDDPNYASKSTGLVDGFDACDIFEKACKPEAVPQPPTPAIAMASKEDVDALGLRVNLDKQSYDDLPTQKELNNVAKAFNDDMKNATSKAKPAKKAKKAKKDSAKTK